MCAAGLKARELRAKSKSDLEEQVSPSLFVFLTCIAAAHPSPRAVLHTHPPLCESRGAARAQHIVLHVKRKL